MFYIHGKIAIKDCKPLKMAQAIARATIPATNPNEVNPRGNIFCGAYWPTKWSFEEIPIYRKDDPRATIKHLVRRTIHNIPLHAVNPCEPRTPDLKPEKHITTQQQIGDCTILPTPMEVDPDTPLQNPSTLIQSTSSKWTSEYCFTVVSPITRH